MIEDLVEVKGRVHFQLLREDGSEIVWDVENIVTTVGKGFIASRMKDTSAAAMSHMAVGTGGGGPAVGDTALVAEISRQPLTNTTVAGAVVTYTGTFGAGQGTGALTEAGILNAGAAGTLLCRTVFSVINKAAADTLNVTWTVTIG